MTRPLMRAQLLAFLAYGFLSAAAFGFVVEYRERRVQSETLAAVFITLPVNALGEVRI